MRFVEIKMIWHCVEFGGLKKCIIRCLSGYEVCIASLEYSFESEILIMK